MSGGVYTSPGAGYGLVGGFWCWVGLRKLMEKEGDRRATEGNG